jgi:hypothetical protein
MLEDYFEGRTGEVICNTCKALRPVRYGYGPATHHGIEAKAVMRSVCLVCGQVATIAAQSLYKFRKESRPHRERTTLAVPQELEDYVYRKLNDVGAWMEPPEMFLRAALTACHDCLDESASILSSIEHEALSKPCVAKINFNARGNIGRVFRGLSAASGISNSSELARRLIVASDGPMKAKVDHELRRLSIAYA